WTLTANGTMPNKEVFETVARDVSWSVTKPITAPSSGEPFAGRVETMLAPLPSVSPTPAATVPLDLSVGKLGHNGMALNHEAFATDLGNRVLLMVRHNMQSAEIRLNPPHLGPLEIQVSVADGETKVFFTSPHAVVREALEMAIPRLRDGLGDLGLTLANTQILDHSLSHHQDERSRFLAKAPTGVNSAIPDESTVPSADRPSRAIAGTALLDIYV
ncbi:MAG: flagellar hook-length control protein FliK, partial [Gammaproteobacteria bacterium]|nr:flagellar hook-length control protein FliK [Gammaproteobacteria bacterium]